ncbi:MAG: DUF3093 domain-containing protein [Mycobacteriales bacterium]
MKPSEDPPVTYHEKLRVPLWWWPAALGVAGVVAAEIHGGAPGLQAVLPYAILLPLTLFLLVAGSRGRVQVRDEVLSVPGARIELNRLAEPVVLDRSALRQQTGPMADRNAFVVSRPWLHSAVRVMLHDPEDDTPYWVIGTRQPERLAAALRTG